MIELHYKLSKHKQSDLFIKQNRAVDILLELVISVFLTHLGYNNFVMNTLHV